MQAAERESAGSPAGEPSSPYLESYLAHCRARTSRLGSVEALAEAVHRTLAGEG